MLVHAYMHFPNDADKREMFGQVIVARFAASSSSGEPVTLAPETITALMAAGRAGIMDGMGDSIDGLLAGEVLLYALRLRNAGLEKPSLDKAQHLASEFFLSARQYDGSNYHGTGRDTVRKAWQSMRPVSHLWAAWTGLAQSCPQEIDRGQWMADRMHATLEMAHAIYKDAIAYTPPNAKEPLLIEGATWALDGVAELPYYLPALSEKEIETANAFVARSRGKKSSPVDKPSMNK